MWELIDRKGRPHLGEFKPLRKSDLSQLSPFTGWTEDFNWSDYLEKSDVFAYKLLIKGQPYIQGVISLQPKNSDGFMFIPLVESAPFNRGTFRVFHNIVEVLFGFACEKSIEFGFEGYVAFKPKSNLYDHYVKKLSAKPAGVSGLHLDPIDAKRLISLYYK